MTTTPKDQRSRVHTTPNPVSDTIWEEIGFAEFPIVTTSLKRPSVNTLEFVEQVGFDSEKREPIHRRWKMAGSEEYGLPRLPDLDLFLALIKISEVHQHQKRLVMITAKEICDAVGITPGGTTYQRVKAGLFRFQTTNYLSDRVFREKGTKEPIIGEAWNIVTEFRLRRDYPDKTVDDGLPPSYVVLGERFLVRLRSGQLKPVDLGVWRQLGTGLQKPLFHFFDKNLYRKDSYEIGIGKLSQRIGVVGHYDRAQLRRLLTKPLKQLVSVGFLSEFSFERSKAEADPVKVIVFPGQNARRGRKRAAQVSIPQESAERAPEGRRKRDSASSVPGSLAHQLAQRWFQSRHEIDDKEPTTSHVQKAQAILTAAGDFETAADALDEAAALGRKNARESDDGRGFPDDLGGVLSGTFVDEAKRRRERQEQDAVLAEKRDREDARARAEHEAYAAWLKVKIEEFEGTPEYDELYQKQLETAAEYQRKTHTNWGDEMVQTSARSWTRRDLEKSHFSRAQWQRETGGADASTSD